MSEVPAYFMFKLAVLPNDAAIEAIWADSFVEIALTYRSLDVGVVEQLELRRGPISREYEYLLRVQGCKARAEEFLSYSVLY